MQVDGLSILKSYMLRKKQQPDDLCLATIDRQVLKPIDQQTLIFAGTENAQFGVFRRDRPREEIPALSQFGYSKYGGFLPMFKTLFLMSCGASSATQEPHYRSPLRTCLPTTPLPARAVEGWKDKTPSI